MLRPEALWLGTNDPHARLRRIEQLDLETEFGEIARLFFSDFRSAMLAMGFAGFLMTYASPRMSRILSATGELEHRVAKRVVDTSLLSGMVMAHGVRHSPGRDAARRVNAMHSRYDIHQEDFVAVGCDSALKAIELAEAFGWRPVTNKEREAVRRYFATVTRTFGGRDPFPQSVEAMQQFMARYAEAQYGFEPQNRRLAEATCDYYASLAPRPWRALFRKVLLSAVEPRIIRSCGLRPPSGVARWAGRLVLKVMARRDPVPDNAQDQLAAFARTVYPKGYDISQLGTCAHSEAAQHQAVA
jgi:hypothetical protein